MFRDEQQRKDSENRRALEDLRREFEDKFNQQQKVHDKESRDLIDKHEKEINERIQAMANTDLSLNNKNEALRKEKD